MPTFHKPDLCWLKRDSSSNHLSEGMEPQLRKFPHKIQLQGIFLRSD